MIFPIPHLYDFSFVALPTWERKHKAESEPADTCDSPEAQSASDADAVDTPWIFKGYQWQLQANWYPFVNPGWDHFVDNDPDEMREREIRLEQDRHEQERHALPAKPTKD